MTQKHNLNTFKSISYQIKHFFLHLHPFFPLIFCVILPTSNIFKEKQHLFSPFLWAIMPLEINKPIIECLQHSYWYFYICQGNLFPAKPLFATKKDDRLKVVPFLSSDTILWFLHINRAFKFSFFKKKFALHKTWRKLFNWTFNWFRTQKFLCVLYQGRTSTTF